MAEQETNGATPQANPAPGKDKPKSPLSTKGRKARHRSTKAEVEHERTAAKVITYLCAGKTIEETAAELDISITWVRRVRDNLPEDFIAQFTQAKTNEISALIEQGLKDQLEAMSNIVAVTRNEVWVTAQRAPELATFFGVINDKTVRILAAIERANDRERAEREHRESETARPAISSGTRREPQEATQGT